MDPGTPTSDITFVGLLSGSMAYLFDQVNICIILHLCVVVRRINITYGLRLNQERIVLGGSASA